MTHLKDNITKAATAGHGYHIKYISNTTSLLKEKEAETWGRTTTKPEKAEQSQSKASRKLLSVTDEANQEKTCNHLPKSTQTKKDGPTHVQLITVSCEGHMNV